MSGGNLTVAETAVGSVWALASEFIGTFALIFIGAGAAIPLDINHDPAFAVAHALTSPSRLIS
jgi:glycerol uptake facilitator-like aquaporin